MNLRGIDLNLLVLLHALLEERHVSRAARRAGLTQPAMSNALDRCRRLFDDALLERAGAGMRLTRRAEALREPLALVLTDIVTLVDPTPPPLDEVERTVGIVVADALADLLAAPMLARLADLAPGIRLSFLPWESGSAALDRLRGGTVDLAVSVLPATTEEIARAPLIEERYLLVGRRDHPAFATDDPAAWLRYPHLVVSADGAGHTPLDDLLAGRGMARSVGMTVPSFLLAPALLRGSDLLALLPSLVVSGGRGAGLAVRTPPIPLDGFRLDLARHRRGAGDAVLDFVSDTMRALLAELRLRGPATLAG